MPPARHPASPLCRDHALPLRAQLQIDDLEREYFDRAHPEHLPGDVLDMILSSLLALFPEAPVSALTGEGIMIPMPASVRLQRNPVLEARAGVDLLVFDERLMKAWDRALAEGSARCSFAPVGHPEITGTLYMLDLREAHGAVVTVAVYDQDAFSSAATSRPEPLEVMPRFATVLKDSRGIVVEIDAAVTKILGVKRMNTVDAQLQAVRDGDWPMLEQALGEVLADLSEGIRGGGPGADRAVVFVDVDGFKQVNDRYSHAVGDEVLTVVAARLRRTVRDGDMVGRIGGDEFLVVCPNVGSPEQAMHLAERMAAAQREDVRLPCGRITLQVSLGVAFARGEAPRAETLVALADHAMYGSKRERLGRPKLAAPAAGAFQADGRAGDPRIDTGQPGALGEGLARAERDAAPVALRASNVGALACALHARDHDTEDHSRAVLALALAVGCELGLAERELLDLETVALLHDVGKIGIRDAVLRKPGKLSEQEWAEMRRHPDIGADILAATPSLCDLAPVIRAEHERWDGCGYPNGLRGEEIPLLSRIVFVCDAYHAMTSDRPYRRALAHGVALREIESNAGSQFCPRSAAALAHVLSAAASRPKPARARRPARARGRRAVSQAATR